MSKLFLESSHHFVSCLKLNSWKKIIPLYIKIFKICLLWSFSILIIILLSFLIKYEIGKGRKICLTAKILKKSIQS